jgi:hypothetical protein
MSQKFVNITIPGPRPGVGFQKTASRICFDILGIDVVPQYRGNDQWMYAFSSEHDAQVFNRLLETNILSRAHDALMELKEEILKFPVDENIYFPDESLAVLRGNFSFIYTADKDKRLEAKNAINYCLDIFSIQPVASYILKAENNDTRDVVVVFNTPVGRAFLARLVEKTMIEETMKDLEMVRQAAVNKMIEHNILLPQPHKPKTSLDDVSPGF